MRSHAQAEESEKVRRGEGCGGWDGHGRDQPILVTSMGTPGTIALFIGGAYVFSAQGSAKVLGEKCWPKLLLL